MMKKQLAKKNETTIQNLLYSIFIKEVTDGVDKYKVECAGKRSRAPGQVVL